MEQDSKERFESIKSLVNRANLSSMSPSSHANYYYSLESASVREWVFTGIGESYVEVPAELFIDLDSIRVKLDERKIATNRRDITRLNNELAELHYHEKGNCVPENVVQTKFKALTDVLNNQADVNHYTKDTHTTETLGRLKPDGVSYFQAKSGQHVEDPSNVTLPYELKGCSIQGRCFTAASKGEAVNYIKHMIDIQHRGKGIFSQKTAMGVSILCDGRDIVFFKLTKTDAGELLEESRSFPLLNRTQDQKVHLAKGGQIWLHLLRMDPAYLGFALPDLRCARFNIQVKNMLGHGRFGTVYKVKFETPDSSDESDKSNDDSDESNSEQPPNSSVYSLQAPEVNCTQDYAVKIAITGNFVNEKKILQKIKRKIPDEHENYMFPNLSGYTASTKALLLHPVGIPVASNTQQHEAGLRKILHSACYGGNNDGHLIMSSRLFNHLVDALQALHNIGIVHRDIKLENILIYLVVIVVFVHLTPFCAPSHQILLFICEFSHQPATTNSC